MNKKMVMYDTTLRDGAQGEGIHFSVGDKLRIAQKLDSFGIEYIEGGWPGSNVKDIEFFDKIRKIKLKNARIAAFGSTRKPGVAVEKDTQVKLLLEAQTPVVTLFGKTWLLHVKEVLRTTSAENLAMIRDTVRYLKAQGREVIYDAEHCFDGYKDDPAYAMACLQTAQKAGADWIVLCDTNGGTLPVDVARITREIDTKVKTGPGIHTHDDCGLAVANALAAVEAGAMQVQGTVNGFGERTGNCNLISVIANLQLKMDRPVVSPKNLRQLRELSLFVDETANQRPNPRAPFVGVTAFAHKGGMHVNAVNKLACSFEHIEPKTVGNRQRVLVGELAGKTNVMLKARELGLVLNEKAPETAVVLQLVKKLESEGYEFEAADASFELLVRRALRYEQPFFELQEYNVSIRKNERHGYDLCEATIKLKVRGEKIHTVAEGHGPVNALDIALRQALARHYPEVMPLRLTDYKVRIIDSDAATAARTRVLIESSDGETEWSTVGVSHDIIEASWQALKDSVEYRLLRCFGGAKIKI